MTKINKEDWPLLIDVRCYSCNKNMALSNASQYDGRYYCGVHTPKEEIKVSVEWGGEGEGEGEWSKGPEIVIAETKEKLEFIEGHHVNTIYVKYNGEQVEVETEKPWLMSGKGRMLIIK